MLSCFTSTEIAENCIKGNKLLQAFVESNLFEIPDMVVDPQVNLKMIERYCEVSAWTKINDLVAEKKMMDIICPMCRTKIDDNLEQSVCCDKVITP